MRLVQAIPIAMLTMIIRLVRGFLRRLLNIWFNFR
jgi:hypothetical protein